MQSVYRNALQHAATIAGEDKLARRLRVSAAVLESWLSGRNHIPSGVFLAVADYLAEIRPPTGAKPPGSESA